MKITSKDTHYSWLNLIIEHNDGVINTDIDENECADLAEQLLCVVDDCLTKHRDDDYSVQISMIRAIIETL